MYNSLQDQHNYSHRTKAEFNNCSIILQLLILSKSLSKLLTSLPPRRLHLVSTNQPVLRLQVETRLELTNFQNQNLLDTQIPNFLTQGAPLRSLRAYESSTNIDNLVGYTTYNIQPIQVLPWQFLKSSFSLQPLKHEQP